MRRKTRGMEKVENLYCTARAQHVMPTAQGSRGRERRSKLIQAFATKLPASVPCIASGMIEGGFEALASHLGVESIRSRGGLCHGIRYGAGRTGIAGRGRHGGHAR
jgi:hypothetical protein